MENFQLATPVPEPDHADFAWAAGVFDGEGSTIARTLTARPGYYQLNVTIPQSGRDGIPPLLLRFQRVMLGMGNISGPSDEFTYMLRFSAREEVRLVLELMWPHLGEIKRAQATRAIELVEQQYASGRRRRRAARRRARELPSLRDRTPADLERAWAAGFFDGEGCFGLFKAMKRVRGPQWYRVRASASQHGHPGIVPEVLRRLQSALGGIGRIECHGDVDDFKWLVEGDRLVESVLDAMAPWLEERKVAAGRQALDAFRAQVRLKGDATHCMRGHEYTYTAMRGGRMRRICNPCARIVDRRKRAKQGIPPRPFKNVARRYTE
jgi:hypothetical protein